MKAATTSSAAAQLDGNGIPVNFFSDPNVRKGFAYCFNYDTYLNDVMLGEGVRSNNVMLPGMIGYQEDSPIYNYDPAKCTELLKASKWKKTGDTYTPDPAGDISLWDTGFRFTATYNTGNTARQTIGQILQTELGAINEKFVVEVTGLPWPTFLKNQRAKQAADLHQRLAGRHPRPAQLGRPVHHRHLRWTAETACGDQGSVQGDHQPRRSRERSRQARRRSTQSSTNSTTIRLPRSRCLCRPVAATSSAG